MRRRNRRVDDTALWLDSLGVPLLDGEPVDVELYDVADRAFDLLDLPPLPAIPEPEIIEPAVPLVTSRSW